MKVMIIEAGIGGLCLAHGLRGSGIDVEVFERRTQRAVEAAHGLHLNADGMRAMTECLPEGLFARIEAAAGHSGAGAGFYDEHLRRLANADSGNPMREQRRCIGRRMLRALLMEGLWEPSWGWVHNDKDFKFYESLSSGGVRAHFADGSHADADILVGADGGNSRVRRQYLPPMAPQDLAVTAISGRTHLTRHATEDLPAALLDGTPNSIVPVGPCWMSLTAWHSPYVPGAAEPDFTSYVQWDWVADRDSYPADLEALAPEVLRDMVLSRIAAWHPALSTLVEVCDLASVRPVHMRSMPQLAAWKSTTVTLLGDAVHTMTPMADVGANIALRDAAELYRALSGSAVGRSEPTEAIGNYEEVMRTYANRALGVSRRSVENAVGGGAVNRRAFRTALRVADAVPPVHRAMFAKRSA